MKTPSDAARGLLTKSDEDLALAQQIFPMSAGQAARLGYMAVFHAAQAALLDLRGRMPKTHSGVRNEFSKLALEESSLGSKYGHFLAVAYDQKDEVDYRTGPGVSPEAAAQTMATAGELVAKIKTILGVE